MVPDTFISSEPSNALATGGGAPWLNHKTVADTLFNSTLRGEAGDGPPVCEASAADGPTGACVGGPARPDR